MTTVGVVKTSWQGTSGGPGLSQICFTTRDNSDFNQAQAQTAVNAVRTFWAAIASYLPNEIILTVLPTVDGFTVLSTNNDLHSSVVAATPPAVVVGTDTGVYSMASGLKVNLHTNDIKYGRRVRGAFYVVPAGQTAYSNAGTIIPACTTAINNAGAAMISSMNSASLDLVVWSRWNKLKHPERLSGYSVVDSVKCNDKTAVLRGRRD
jgi:hypothetical protein